MENKALILPLHIATIAALTPDDIEVDLWDEAVHGQLDESTELEDYDLVGITGYPVQLQRVKEIAQVFRQRGLPVAIGGAGVSAAPERYLDDFDILFLGEAELTWPKFLADFLAGSYHKEYRQITKPDLALSPPPRWDSLENQMKNYLAGAVQTTRGCPFDCEFCDVIYLFGRRSRHKPIDRVLEEVVNLQRLGMGNLFFCDDNFTGNPHYTKELLRELIPLNNSFQNPLRFSTQLDISVAKDDELLQLLADANFSNFFIGIESPNIESLKETGKLQNVKSDLIADCKKVMSYGMYIVAAMIVGFDHDTPEIFDQQFEFIQETYMPAVRINILKAPHGIRLWHRLLKEGRLLNVETGLYDEEGFFGKDTRGATNIIPKRMTRAELFSGYLNLVERVYDWDNFAERIKKFISNVKRKPNVPQKSELSEGLSPDLSAFLFSLDEKVQSVIFDIFFHTRKNAPFMMRKVLGSISRQYMAAANLPLLRENILKQIQFEESVDMEQFIFKEEVLVPESF
ncbi:MAG: radical SAM protein, partial [Candidatus Zixiibacteriota bacterium]